MQNLGEVKDRKIGLDRVHGGRQGGVIPLQRFHAFQPLQACVGGSLGMMFREDPGKAATRGATGRRDEGG